jgi:hypothetical protein
VAVGAVEPYLPDDLGVDPVAVCLERVVLEEVPVERVVLQTFRGVVERLGELCRDEVRHLFKQPHMAPNCERAVPLTHAGFVGLGVRLACAILSD